MIRFNLFFFSMIFATALFSQATPQKVAKKETIQLGEGLELRPEISVPGTKPINGDYVSLSYVGKLISGTVFDQRPKDAPMVFQLGQASSNEAFEKALKKMTPGTTAQLMIPSKLAYGSRGAGKLIPPNSDLYFDLTLLDIMTFEEYDQFLIEQEEKARLEYELEEKRQFQKDLQIIKEYAKENKLKMRSLPSGLGLIIKKKGKKPFPTDGKKISVKYKGYLTDGTVFDESPAGKPFSATLGQTKIIAGWDEALRLLGKGGQATLLIPARLGYGPQPIIQGDLHIPGNSVLLFDLKILQIE
ncbi:MAG: FKBP-type peptidyl-prolyl cis-trans isomerase [Saprospiraceae bacterium]|nr:FKBP-type peptidyl-prolyl cis-trans isomerase [Saprospiraceae bacterium]